MIATLSWYLQWYLMNITPIFYETLAVLLFKVAESDSLSLLAYALQ